MTPPEADKPDKPEQPGKQPRRRGDILGISALAAALLSGLAGDKLSQSLDKGGWVSVVGFIVTVGFALIWAIINAPVAVERLALPATFGIVKLFVIVLAVALAVE